MLLTLLMIGTLWLAWSNGANDNFKGVATLFGSATLSYRQALGLASLGTLAGALVSIIVAKGLVHSFSGQGLIAVEALNDRLLAAVLLGAAATVLLATLLGMPTSTTHALVGTLVGAGWLASASGINLGVLATTFATPLLLSPVLAIGLTVLVYPLLSRWRRRLGVDSESCVCLDTTTACPIPAGTALAMSPAATATPSLTFAPQAVCTQRYAGTVVGFSAQRLVAVGHSLCGLSVCFARAVNDTPKIAAIMLSAQATPLARHPGMVLALVAVAMVAGGLVQSRKVAETMSLRITGLNPGQGLTANLVTAVLVLGASRLGVPVSTTHVSCGAIFGIGACNGQRDLQTIGQIALTWVLTLPLGVVLGAAIYAGLGWAGV
jgi:inorganic phosphate transporter, PiT family